MSLPITAEGVEDEVAQDLLKGLGCTDAQGWFYAKAMSTFDVAKAYYGVPLSTDIEPSAVAPEPPTKERRSYARRGR